MPANERPSSGARVRLAGQPHWPHSVRDMLAQSRGRTLSISEKAWLDKSCKHLSTEAALVDRISRAQAYAAIWEAVNQLSDDMIRDQGSANSLAPQDTAEVVMTLNPPVQPYHWTFRRVMWATLVLASVALSFWLLYRFNQVVFVVFTAIVMGTVIRPVVTWLHQRGVPQIAGVILVYLLLLALLIGFVLLLFPLIVEQGTTIAAAVPDYYQSLRQWMVSSSQSIDSALE